LSRIKILVVEDESLICQEVKKILTGLDYEVCGCASTASEAIQKAYEEKPDLILMDIILKGKMNGIEASKVILKESDIPIVYLTASSDNITFQKAKSSNPYGYIVKPYDKRDLQTAIEVALYRHRMEKKLIESQKWLITTIESLEDAVIATDSTGIVKNMNAMAENLTGWKKKEAIGRKVYEVFRTVDILNGDDRTKTFLDEIKTENEKVLIETEMLISRTGERFYIDKRTSLTRDDRGNIIGIVISFRNVTEKRILKQKLLESEKKFHLIFEKANDAILLIENGICKECNTKAEKIFGRRREEILNQKIGTFIHSYQKEGREVDFYKFYKDLKDEVKVKDRLVEWAIERKDGNCIDVEVSFSSVFVENHFMELAIIRDISERKILEKALQASEKKYRQLIEVAEEGILSIDENNIINFVNPRMAEMTGYEPSQIIGQTLSSFLYPSDRALCNEHINSVRKQNRSVFECRLYRKDNSYVSARITASPIIENNIFKGIIAVATDITELKKEAEEIRKLSYAVEQSLSSIVITDTNGNIEYVNQKFLDLTGYSREELIGKNPRILKSGETSPEEYKRLWKTISEGGAWKGVFHNKKKNGELYWELASISPIKDKDGKITHFLGVKEDITDRKRAEEALQKTLKELSELNKNLDKRVDEELRKNREKDRILIQQSRLAGMGEMIGNIAHQWRQPINALGIIIQNLIPAYENKKLTRKYLENVVQKSMDIIKNMSGTIDDFRNFFKPEKEKEQFSIKEAIEKTISFMEASLTDYNIKVEFKFTKDVLRMGYFNEYCQALVNILSNARDAVIEREIKKANIWIELKEKDGISCVTISDNAGGIPEDIIDRIFDPYFSTKPQGTGIGLYMSKMIIEKSMGGRLFARNILDKKRGKGAQFTIEL